MNPWALVLLLLAVGALIVSVKGTQDNLIAAVIGKPYGNSTLSTTSNVGSQGFGIIQGGVAALNGKS